MGQVGNLDELVRVESDDIRFPSICPVCGRPTVAYGSIFASKGMQVRRKRGHGVHLRRDRWALEVPVCERHSNSTNMVERMGAPIITLGGISLLALFYSVLAIGMSILDHRPVGPHFMVMLLVGLLVAPVFLRILGPSKLERCITILRTDSLTNHLVLRIRNHDYLEELIRINPRAERPKGIRSGPSDAEVMQRS